MPHDFLIKFELNEWSTFLSEKTEELFEYAVMR